MKHPVVWFEVMGQDSDRLTHFYSELFGWKIDRDNPKNYGLVDTGSKTGIPGGVGTASPQGRAGVTFYVASDDLDASLARAKALGGRTVMAPSQFPGGPELALFEDPEGHLIGLVNESRTESAA